MTFIIRGSRTGNESHRASSLLYLSYLGYVKERRVIYYNFQYIYKKKITVTLLPERYQRSINRIRVLFDVLEKVVSCIFILLVSRLLCPLINDSLKTSIWLDKVKLLFWSCTCYGCRYSDIRACSLFFSFCCGLEQK